MGLGLAVVSPDTRVSHRERRRSGLPRRLGEVSGLLRGQPARSGEHRHRFADGRAHADHGEVPARVSPLIPDDGLVVRPNRGRPHDAQRLRLHRDLRHAGERQASECDRHASRAGWRVVFRDRRTRHTVGPLSRELHEGVSDGEDGRGHQCRGGPEVSSRTRSLPRQGRPEGRRDGVAGFED